MAAFNRARVLWTYTTDQGADVPIRAMTSYSTQAVVGGAAFTTLLTEPKRYGLKPRVAICKGNVTAVKRRVIIYDSTAYDAIVPLTTTISVPDATLTTLEVATVQSKEGERHRGAAIPA